MALANTSSSPADSEADSVVRYTVTNSALGTMLVAASDRGVCRLSFDEDASALGKYLGSATLVQDPDMDGWIETILTKIEKPSLAISLPLDMRGTPFQRSVWDYLATIPAGETRTYLDIATALGAPGATRAVGSANGANPVSVLVPCHRVIRSDGGLGGYAYGLDRKRRLLEAEGAIRTLL